MNAYLLVGLGGALGAMARFGVGGLIGSLPNGFPLATMLINITGSLAMGLLVGILARSTPQYGEEVRLFVAVGLFGGFTTFSAFSLESILLLERGEIGLAALYIVGSVLLSVGALWAGLMTVRVVA